MERRLPWAAFGLVLAPVFLVAAAAEDHAVGLYVSVLFTFLAVLVTGVSARAYHESAILGPSPKAAKAAAKENVSRPLSPSRRKPVDSLLDDTSGRSLSSLAWGGYGRPRQHRHGAWRDTATGEGEYGAHDVPETGSAPSETSAYTAGSRRALLRRYVYYQEALRKRRLEHEQDRMVRQSQPKEPPSFATVLSRTKERAREVYVEEMYAARNVEEVDSRSSPEHNADHASSLRQQAIQERHLMGRAFAASKQAYAAGDGEEARNLSLVGKTHQQNRDQLNAEAAEWSFNENNKAQPIGFVDLHGLYVEEAIKYTQRAIKDGLTRGLPELRLIVGKGNNSPSSLARIKPAIASLLKGEGLITQVDQCNASVLVAQLQGQGIGQNAGSVCPRIRVRGPLPRL